MAISIFKFPRVHTLTSFGCDSQLRMELTENRNLATSRWVDDEGSES